MEAALVWAQEDIALTQTKKEQVMRIGKGTGRTARWLLAAVMAFGASLAMAQATTGITITKHNLGSTSTTGNNKTGATGEICVFCHTPHAADVSTAGVPLWNKRLNTGSVTAFTTYASSTMNAVLANDGQTGNLSIGSVSLACLSCHDGTQAMDNILNAPGSGGYAADGGGTGGLGWAWTGGGVDNTTGAMINGTTTLAMLGRDLSNDHPIGIQYCGGGPGLSAPTAACSDADFNAPASGSIGGTTAFWVDTGTAGNGRQKTDMILFNRSFPVNGAIAAGTYPSVECASCHDPHSSTNATFLRVSNTGSAVCLACHNK